MPPDSVRVSGGDRDEPARRETFADTTDSAPLRLAVTGKTGLVLRVWFWVFPARLFAAVGSPVVHARLAISNFAVLAPGIGFGIALDLAGMFCC